MDEKISLEAITSYGNRYAEKILADFFSKKEKITGSEILTLCNVQQVNLFIIKELFRAWREESNKVKSPYFNFEDEEVKEAYENLMNLLSKNIVITEPHFSPLLRKAIVQALLVIFNPYDFFSKLITGKDNKLEVTSFQEEIKYLKVNKAPLERMMQKLEEKNVTELSGNEAFAILDQILEEVNFTPEDIEDYIEKFSAVTPLDPTQFFVGKEADVATPLSISAPPRHEETKIQKANLPKDSGTRPALTPSVNQKHAPESRPSIVENFQRIKSIKENLTINQKFMFTKVLFHGDFELFTRAVERLDQFDKLQAAIHYIEEEHASTWDRDSEEFHEFMELVEKRFI